MEENKSCEFGETEWNNLKYNKGKVKEININLSCASLNLKTLRKHKIDNIGKKQQRRIERLPNGENIKPKRDKNNENNKINFISDLLLQAESTRNKIDKIK